jgi:hypothetical protein
VHIRYVEPVDILAWKPVGGLHTSIDVYSFAVVVWELATGLDIVEHLGLSGRENREIGSLVGYPTIIASRIQKGASDLVAMCGEKLSDLAQLIKECWRPDRINRPSADDILVRATPYLLPRKPDE